MTIGDVLAVIALVLLVTSSWGALIIFWSYLSPRLVADAKSRLTASPGACVFRGAVVTLITLVFTLATMGAMVGATRLIPFAIAGGLFLVSSIGSAGVVKILADRIDPNSASSDGREINRTVRATIVYCLAGLFPVGGWFIVAPVALMATVGSMFGSKPSVEAANLAHPSLGITQTETFPVAGG